MLLLAHRMLPATIVAQLPWICHDQFFDFCITFVLMRVHVDDRQFRSKHDSRKYHCDSLHSDKLQQQLFECCQRDAECSGGLSRPRLRMLSPANLKNLKPMGRHRWLFCQLLSLRPRPTFRSCLSISTALTKKTFTNWYCTYVLKFVSVDWWSFKATDRACSAVSSEAWSRLQG